MVNRTLILACAVLIAAVPVRAEPQTMTTQKLCQQLTEYQPSGDVDYKPGTDAHGRVVAPADLDGGNRIEIPDTTYLAITVDQAQHLGLPTNIPYKAEAYIGGVTVTKDGSVYFNGKRVSQTQVQALCAPEQNREPKVETPLK